MEIQVHKKYAVRVTRRSGVEVRAVKVSHASSMGGWVVVELGDPDPQRSFWADDEWFEHELVETPGPDGETFLARPGSKIFRLPS